MYSRVCKGKLKVREAGETVNIEKLFTLVMGFEGSRVCDGILL